jgi:pectate lyase C
LAGSLERFRTIVLTAGCAVLSSIACGGGEGEPVHGPRGGSAGAATSGTGGHLVSSGSSGSPGTAGSPRGGTSSAGSGMGNGGNASGGGGATSQAGGSPEGGGGTQAGSGGSSAGGSGGSSAGGSGGASSVVTCSTITDFGVVSATITVESGQTYDGECRRYRADPNTLGDGSQAEDQKPVFVLEDGARLINVVLGAPAADGIHTRGDVTLENITWEDIGEDALTVKESGSVVLNGGSAKNGDDKIFQLNAASTFRVSNFKASQAGKFIRQNGDTTFKVEVHIDGCDISNMDESIFRTDSSTSTVSMTNTRYHAIGDALFLGVAAGNITQSNNTEY